jgi:hypothetical protein
LEVQENPLWSILVETVHTLPLYKPHKNYIRDKILKENPMISSEEISNRLSLPLGEAIVILEELKKVTN